jgi:hypothetical protein
MLIITSWIHYETEQGKVCNYLLTLGSIRIYNKRAYRICSGWSESARHARTTAGGLGPEATRLSTHHSAPFFFHSVIAFNVKHPHAYISRPVALAALSLTGCARAQAFLASPGASLRHRPLA